MLNPLQDEDSFLAWLRQEFELPVEALSMDSLVASDLAFDSLELFRLMLMLEMLVPGFELPEQLDLGDVHVRDVYHYVINARDLI